MAWNAALTYNSSQSNYPGKIFDNVGWVRGTKNTAGGWGAYLWVLQNRIAFQASTSAWWTATNDISVAITNVMVGSLGDYQAMEKVDTNVPPLSMATNKFPGADLSDEATYQVDITNVFYELVVPDIRITPRFAVTCVGGSNVQYTVTGTNIPSGVTWSIIPSGVGATIQTNADWYHAEVTPGNVATNYKVRATSKDNPNFYDQVNLAVVGLLSSLQYKIGTNSWTNMPDPLYVCKDTTVDFKAIKVPTNAAWPTGKPVWGGLVSGSGMETNSYTFSTISTSATDYKIVSAECGNTVSGRVFVIKVELITPAGDPVNAAIQFGDGQNEFTYSTASPGVLTMNLKARVTPSGVANQIKDKVHFTVEAIGGSIMAWDPTNSDGKPTASGDNLLATVRFTGLPANNSAFGTKKAAVYYDNYKQDEKPYEIFYPRDFANHPGWQSGSKNWFHYWSQAIGANNVTYSPGSSLYGECPGMLYWSYSTSQNKDIVIIYDMAATEDPGDANADHGKKATSGIDTFEDTYLHEHYHTVQIDQADNVVGIVPNTPWRYGWSWNQSSHNHWSKGEDDQPGVAGTDDDSNGTADDLIVSGPGELGHGDDVLLDSGYDWPQAFGSLPPTPWAGGGPIEDQAYNQEPDNENARAVVDWGDPGKQHKTLNKYDD